MKNSLINIALLISVSMLTLVACSSNTQRENTGLGAVSGGVIGGVAGSFIGSGTGQVVAIGVGAVAGALLGGYVGHNMDHSDNKQMCNALNHNATNKPSHWHNKKTGNQYTFTPKSKVMAYNGNNHCRQYTTTAIISGKQQTLSGVACRQTDGSWKQINS